VSDAVLPVALVTGGGGDIGRAIALRFAQKGSAVAVVDRDEKSAADTAASIEAAGGRARFTRADVGDSAEVAAFVDETERMLGPIGVFVNNAGVEGVITPIHEYPDEIFDRLWRVNARGVFLGIKHVLGRMIPRNTGAIVNIASTSAIRGRGGLAGYVASKHAVLGLTRVAALDVVGTSIRVNAVLPGPIQTRMIDSLDQQLTSRGGVPRSKLLRYGRPEDVANIVTFLASDEAAHVNGAAWVVDAGSTIP
jgi:NAD(P)-dependent dehydrogenase (short-subunit alcohol dehydrogenase family)